MISWYRPRYRDIGQENVKVGEERTNTKIPIDLGVDLYEWVRDRAYRQRRPIAELVRESLRDYRDRVEPQLDLPIERLT